MKVTFSYVGLKNIVQTFNLSKFEDVEYIPVMKIDVEQLSTTIITGRKNKRIAGVTVLDIKAAENIPTANSGVERLIAYIPGAFIIDELSTQCSVRGGHLGET